MTTYGVLLDLVAQYFIDLGYNPQVVNEYFSSNTFREIAVIRLANANVMIKNKTDHSSHQTHIAVTGEMIELFYDLEVFATMVNDTIDYRNVLVSPENLEALKNIHGSIQNPFHIKVIEGKVTIGKRTQKQVQLSKKNICNSPCFNELRLGLFENDLLIMLKTRNDNKIFCIGIPQTFYLDVIPNFSAKFETNTYLRIPHNR